MGVLGIPATTNQAVCHLLFDPEQCDPVFAFHALQFQSDSLIAMGKGGAQPNINQGIIREYPLIVPKISEQRIFSRAVEAMDALRMRLSAHLAELDTLFASLQSRAFKGEL